MVLMQFEGRAAIAEMCVDEKLKISRQFALLIYCFDCSLAIVWRWNSDQRGNTRDFCIKLCGKEAYRISSDYLTHILRDDCFSVIYFISLSFPLFLSQFLWDRKICPLVEKTKTGQGFLADQAAVVS